MIYFLLIYQANSVLDHNVRGGAVNGLRVLANEEKFIDLVRSSLRFQKLVIFKL